MGLSVELLHEETEQLPLESLPIDEFADEQLSAELVPALELVEESISGAATTAGGEAKQNGSMEESATQEAVNTDN